MFNNYVFTSHQWNSIVFSLWYNLSNFDLLLFLSLPVLQECPAAAHLIQTQTATLWDIRFWSDFTLGSCYSSCPGEVHCLHTRYCCVVWGQFSHRRGGLCSGEHTEFIKLKIHPDKLVLLNDYRPVLYIRFSVRRGEPLPVFCIFHISSAGGTPWAPLWRPHSSVSCRTSLHSSPASFSPHAAFLTKSSILRYHMNYINQYWGLFGLKTKWNIICDAFYLL